MKPVAHVAYVTGWRVRSELLTRQWSHVDFEAGWIRLEPGESKNREGHMFPMTPTLRAVLERQRAHTRAIERDQGQVIPWVFHRDGQPIKHFRRAWLTACQAASAPHRIPHDFRRTAVRNLERAGVPRSGGGIDVLIRSIVNRDPVTALMVVLPGEDEASLVGMGQKVAIRSWDLRGRRCGNRTRCAFGFHRGVVSLSGANRGLRSPLPGRERPIVAEPA